MDLNFFFEGKHIALIGPSKGLINANQGPRIDAHDVVVRLNHQWPIAIHHEVDLGVRMDILYHCCNPDYSVMRFATPQFQNTRFVFYEQGIQTSLLRILCSQRNIPSIDISQQYERLDKLLKTLPNTGLVAIVHLLSFPIASLTLFGITFFQEAYYDGYPGHGAHNKHWLTDQPPRQIWKHHLDVQFIYFLESIIHDPRLHIDDHSRRIMGIDKPI